MRKLSLILLAFMFTFTTSSAFAVFPDKTITFICPYAAGGTSDIIGRSLAKEIEKVLKVTVIVKNTTGGGGTIGAQDIASAKSDGYTIGLLPLGPLVMQPHLRKLPYTIDSFSYLGLVSDTPMVIISNLKAPWTNFQEFVAYAKQNPNKLIYTSVGPGSIAHVTKESIFKNLGIELKHMPSPDDPNALAAISSGTAHIYSGPNSYKGYDVQRLAVTTKNRTPTMPDTPSVFELGVKDIPEFSAWYMLVAPAGIKPEVFKVLEEAIKSATQSPDYIKIMNTIDTMPAYLSPEDSRKLIDKSFQDFKVIMTDLGMAK